MTEGWLPFSCIVDGKYQGKSVGWIHVVDHRLKEQRFSTSWFPLSPKSRKPFTINNCYLFWLEGEWFDTSARPVKVWPESSLYFFAWVPVAVGHHTRQLTVMLSHHWQSRYGGEHAFKR